jgi:hypothetical protein
MDVKAKGNRYEQQIAREFSDIDQQPVQTTRATNRALDAKKVDVKTKQFAIQCKNLKTNANYSKILKEMQECNDEGGMNVLFSKVTRAGEYVILTKKDFYKLIDEYGTQNS